MGSQHHPGSDSAPNRADPRARARVTGSGPRPRDQVAEVLRAVTTLVGRACLDAWASIRLGLKVAILFGGIGALGLLTLLPRGTVPQPADEAPEEATPGDTGVDAVSLPEKADRQQGGIPRQTRKKNPHGKTDAAQGVNPRQASPVAVDAPALWMEYGSNALAADRKYRGGVLVAGVVHQIGKAPDGRYYVAFSIVAGGFAVDAFAYAHMSARERKWWAEGYPANVVCYLAEGAQQDLVEVKQGQTIRVRAKIRGVTRTDEVYGGYTVDLHDGVFVEVLPE